MNNATRLVFVVVLLASACSPRPMQPGELDGNALDHRVTMNTYLEEGALVALGVNTDATRRREKSPLIPLGVVLANNGGPLIKVNREYLTLIDDTGRRYPLASIEEFKAVRSQASLDLTVSARFGEVFANRYQALSHVPSVFFPIQVTEPGAVRRGVVSDQIELPRQHWIIDVIYFPHPEGELLGRNYELWFAPPELEDPVFVRFAVE
jgi:hypothetical protein